MPPSLPLILSSIRAMLQMNFQSSFRLFAFLTAVCAFGAVVDARAAERDTVVIGAGQVAGVYYPAAGAICQLVNDAATADDPICVVIPGESSKASLQALRANRIDFAIVQSDWQFWAHSGADFFTDPTPFVSLNAVMSLHAEPLIIAVRGDSGITSLADLKGKRVSVGAPATAGRGMMEALMAAHGRTMSDFGEVQELATSQNAAALCNNSVDSVVYAVGSPSATLAALTATCAVSFLPLAGLEVDKLLIDNSFYRKAAIPAGIYTGIDEAVPTFGVGATLVTRSDVPKESVISVVTTVFENVEIFRSLYPALRWLKTDQMARDGLSAPIHPAASRYFADREGS